MNSDLTNIPARPRAAALTVALLSIAASIAGIGNRFAYDDVPLIATNDRVHTITDWWLRFAEPYWPETFAHTLYRPITVLGFSIQWTLGAGGPLVFHVVSILLYAACTVGVLLLARQLLAPAAAWLAAALFAVHPVHVEVVANSRRTIGAARRRDAGVRIVVVHSRASREYDADARRRDRRNAVRDRASLQRERDRSPRPDPFR